MVRFKASTKAWQVVLWAALHILLSSLNLPQLGVSTLRCALAAAFNSGNLDNDALFMTSDVVFMGQYRPAVTSLPSVLSYLRAFKSSNPTAADAFAVSDCGVVHADDGVTVAVRE